MKGWNIHVCVFFVVPQCGLEGRDLAEVRVINYFEGILRLAAKFQHARHIGQVERNVLRRDMERFHFRNQT